MYIRSERVAAGLTQADLARRAGVPQPNLSAYENGRRSPTPEVLDRIRDALAVPPSRRIDAHRDEIRRTVAAHRAHSPQVFGSVARGDDAPGSDVDLLVQFDDDASLLDEVGLRLALSELLRVNVDVVGIDTLRGSVGDRIRRDAVPL